jgi:hypothetical protein
MSTRSASASAFVARPIDPVFPVITTHDPARFYPKYGVLPAVVAVRDQTGDWDAVGQTRQLVLSDGGTVVETLTNVAAPDFFGYTLTDFTGLFATLVASARSEWRFARVEGGTSIAWTYSFTSRPGWGVVVASIVRFAWAPYMRKVLPSIAASAAAATV